MYICASSPCALNMRSTLKKVAEKLEMTMIMTICFGKTCREREAKVLRP